MDLLSVAGRAVGWVIHPASFPSPHVPHTHGPPTQQQERDGAHPYTTTTTVPVVQAEKQPTHIIRLRQGLSLAFWRDGKDLSSSFRPAPVPQTPTPHPHTPPLFSPLPTQQQQQQQASKPWPPSRASGKSTSASSPSNNSTNSRPNWARYVRKVKGHPPTHATTTPYPPAQALSPYVL